LVEKVGKEEKNEKVEAEGSESQRIPKEKKQVEDKKENSRSPDEVRSINLLRF
jgi:hypothetical protein